MRVRWGNVAGYLASMGLFNMFVTTPMTTGWDRVLASIIGLGGYLLGWRVWTSEEPVGSWRW